MRGNRAFLSAIHILIFILLAAGVNAFLLSLPPSPLPGNPNNDTVILQSSSNDCGPAALQMIFEHFGIQTSREEIDTEVHPGEEGTPMLRLMKMAEKKGLRTAGWRLTFDDLAKRNAPAILFIRKRHFVVVDSVRSDRVFMRDPGNGRMIYSKSQLLRVWKGEALIFADQ